MPKFVLYCAQNVAPSISADGKLACDGGMTALQVGTLDTTLDTPDADTVAAVWTAAFSLVMVCFLVGRAVGAVLHMIREGYGVLDMGPTGAPEKIVSNTTLCPGISLTASAGKCPASNFPEPAAAPVKTISDAAADLTQAQKATALDPQIIAQIANEFWQSAASAPGYNGLPYDATQPITAADAAAWQASNPSYWPSVGDFVAPQAAPSGGTASSPFTLPTSATPVSSADPSTQPSTGTNPSTQPLENLGPDPGIGSPALEQIPTAQQILSPLMNLFPSLKSFVVPSIDAACPHWSFSVFSRQYTIADHCTLLENIRPSLYAAMAVAYALMALLIVLAA